jgi:hypothetical protein
MNPMDGSTRAGHLLGGSTGKVLGTLLIVVGIPLFYWGP